MNTKKINQTIAINASKETVWDVLTNERYTSIWYAEFSPGSKAETDWQEGSKAIFTDHTGNGLAAKILVSKPAEELVIAYTGLFTNGKEDDESKAAKAIQGGKESYRLTEEAGVTQLETACDMNEAMYEMMAAAWQKAVQKIRELAETAEAVPV